MPWKDPEKAAEYQKGYQARWHQDHKEERLAEIYRRKAEVYWYIQDLKATLRCADCGIHHPAVLQFHHKNREDKTMNIGDAGRRKLSLDRVKKEIAKCIVLCANCHFIRHWQEGKQKRRPDLPNLSGQIAEAEYHLSPTPQEVAAFEAVFGTSGTVEGEAEAYREYYGVKRK